MPLRYRINSRIITHIRLVYYFVHGLLLCYVELRNNGLLNNFDSKWSHISQPAAFGHLNTLKIHKFRENLIYI